MHFRLTSQNIILLFWLNKDLHNNVCVSGDKFMFQVWGHELSCGD
ncbi:hypothetical protein Xkoz_02137 [Xenorhabdus kozodoii]|uniref:Uncharacterized protein n=1 Tax=Xenorhabdus kozodoii TaxID=351676 RepID=A0A2D0LC30_9GAMM|nr:hypothetical protein Xkoz_02137 [Xenorhabdus kozodoii]